MNRTALFRALALVLVIGLLFGIYPELDLKLAALFYDPATKTFPLKLNTLPGLARAPALWVACGRALPAIVVALGKFAPPRRARPSARAASVVLRCSLFP